MLSDDLMNVSIYTSSFYIDDSTLKTRSVLTFNPDHWNGQNRLSIDVCKYASIFIDNQTYKVL